LFTTAAAGGAPAGYEDPDKGTASPEQLFFG